MVSIDNENRFFLTTVSYGIDSNMTFRKVVDIWESQWARFNLSLTSVEEYIYLINLRIMDSIGSLKIDTIRPFHIQEQINRMAYAGKSKKTILKSFTAINSIFRFAKQTRIISENPCDDCFIPRIKGRQQVRFFSPEQARTFLEWVKMNEPLKWQAFFALALYGGLRRGELIALSWDDIDFERRTVSINKSAAVSKNGQLIKETKTPSGNRKIILPEQCFTLLKKHKLEQQKKILMTNLSDNGSDKFVFGNHNENRRMNVQLPTHKFKQILNDINRENINSGTPVLPDLRLHDLRHTNATLLISEGVDIETVSHRMGHAKTSITLDIYSHALPEKDMMAANILEDVLTPKLSK